MRRFVKTITIGAAIAASAALAAAPAVAAEPEVGVFFVTPTHNQLYVNGPVSIEMARVEKWDQMVEAYGGPATGAYGYYVDVVVQRNEGGQWNDLIHFQKPFYDADMKMNLWSLSSSGAPPMSNFPGLTEYRLRALSWYKDTVVDLDLVKWTEWYPFHVNNNMVIQAPSAGDIPGVGPSPSEIRRLPAERLRPAPEVGPGPVERVVAPVERIAPVERQSIERQSIERRSIERESIEIERVAPERLTR